MGAIIFLAVWAVAFLVAGWTNNRAISRALSPDLPAAVVEDMQRQSERTRALLAAVQSPGRDLD